MNQIFEDKLNGKYGVGNQSSAQNLLKFVRTQYVTGSIHVTDKGVPVNAIGRPVSTEICQVLQYMNVKYDEEATQEAYSQYLDEALAAYRTSTRTMSDEDRAEMRNEFGEGTKVVDVISGKEIII